MGFTVLVAGDVKGRTYNFEYTFPTLPTLSEFTDQVEAVFSKELNDVTTVVKLQVRDTAAERWIDMNSGRQLKDGCQVYIFFAEDKKSTVTSSGAVVTALGTPGVRPPPTLAPPPATPNTTASASHAPAPRPAQDPIRLSFDFLDANQCRKVSLQNMATAFDNVRLSFPPHTLEDIFRKADHNGDGLVTFAEWQRFIANHPKLLDTMTTRIEENLDERQKHEAAAKLERELERLSDIHMSKEVVHRECTEAFEAHRRRVLEAEAVAEDCKQKEGETAVRREGVLQEIDVISSELRDAEANETHARKREEELAKRVQSHLQSVEEAAVAVTKHDSDVAAARDRIRSIEYELEEAKRNLAQQEGNRQAAVNHLLSSQESEAGTRAGLSGAQLDSQNSHDLVVKIEYSMSRAQDALRAATAIERDAVHTAKQSLQTKEIEMRELRKAEDRMQGAYEEQAEAVKNLKVRLDELASMNKDFEMLADRSFMTAQQEMGIVEEELRLRNTRASLEEQEARLGALHGQHKAKRRDDPPAYLISQHRERDVQTNAALNLSNISAVEEHYPTPSPLSHASAMAHQHSPGHAVRGLADAIHSYGALLRN